MKSIILSALHGIKEITVKDYIFAVVDVLRASSTILTLMEKGAEHIRIVGEVEEALALREDGYTLIGERGDTFLRGFDLDNSPYEVFRHNWHGKKVVLTTTNGTRILLAVRNGYRILTVGFRNIQAAARYLKKCDKPVAIIPVGHMGEFRVEDELCARSLQSLMKGQLVNWNAIRSEILTSIQGTIIRKGGCYAKDVSLSLEQNTTNILPFMDKDLVVKK